MSLLLGLVIYGTAAVLIALFMLVARQMAAERAKWPDDNTQGDIAALRNVMRVLTLALIAFALVVAFYGATHGQQFKLLPLAAMSLIAVIVVRLRMYQRDATSAEKTTRW